MRITFVFEGLFPGATRAARHVEALADRFRLKGHHVSVVTTALPRAKDPPEIPVLRLSRAPGGSSEKDRHLFLKSISRHLKEEGTELVFAEGLTPLSGLAVKAAGDAGIRTIVRVLCDRDGVAHAFAEGRRTPRRTVNRRIAGLLEQASAAAASSRRCAELVAAHCDGPIHVIEKCVDLNVFRRGRTTKRDLEQFLAASGARGRRVLLYGREALREPTAAEILPVLPHLREYAADLLFMVAGQTDAERLMEEARSQGVEDLVRAVGPLEGRRFFAAYEAATVFLVPPSSAASGRELLEAMAMGCPVACFEQTAALEEGILQPDRTGLVLPREPREAARKLGTLLQDEARLGSMCEHAAEVARRHDINVAIDKVEELAVEVLGMPAAQARVQAPADTTEDPGDMPDDETRKDADNGEQDQQRRKEPGRRRGRGGESGQKDRERRGREKPEQAAKKTSQESSEGSEGPQRGRGRKRRRRTRSPGPGVEELGASTGIDVLDVPTDREGRRKWDLEPGLTLKDLMPFLRPPKTVTILGASTGSGHARAASALVEAFKAVDRNLVVRQLDLLDLVSKVYRAPFVRTFLDDLSRNPALFGRPFETWGDGGEAQLPPELDELQQKVFDAALDEVVVDKRPDHLVCTHWLPFRHLEQLMEQERLTARVLAMVCDPVIHERWMSPVVEHYLVADDPVRTWLEGRGVEASSVSVTGIPVSPAFSADIDRDRVASGMGIDRGRPTVLLRPGGIGATERILEVVRRLLDLEPATNLLVVAGKNDRLREDVEGLKGKGTVKAFGFVQNIRELMGVADLMVTRASPHTVAEGLAARLPLVLLRPAPGVEERYADQLLRWNVAVKAYGEEDLVGAVRELAGSRRRLREMQEAVGGQGRPDAASAAVDRISRLVR